MPDVNGVQIRVTRIETQDRSTGPEVTQELVEGWTAALGLAVRRLFRA